MRSALGLLIGVGLRRRVLIKGLVPFRKRGEEMETFQTRYIRTTRARPCVRAGQLSKSKDRGERFVDSPLLFRSEVSDQVTEPAGVDGSYLFNEHSGRRPEQVDLGPE